MQASRILITAATGNVGTFLVRALQRKNMSFTAATRNASKAKEKFDKPLETVYLNFKHVSSFAPALKGKEMLFLCGPSATPNAEDLLMPLIEAAQAENIKHLVFIASHPKAMQKIEESGMDYTFIKANFFMQNFELYQIQDIRDKNQIFMPAGDGKAPFIHTRDVGEVAAEVLDNPGAYRNQTLYITGPQMVDHYEIADVFSDVLEKKIFYQNPSDEEYRREMEARGFSESYINAMIAVFGKIKKGKVAGKTDGVEQVLERKPVPFKTYVEENKGYFL
ncbi:MAG: SDR family oxidoreductase [Bacteroidales bacterium]